MSTPAIVPVTYDLPMAPDASGQSPGTWRYTKMGAIVDGQVYIMGQIPVMLTTSPDASGVTSQVAAMGPGLQLVPHAIPVTS